METYSIAKPKKRINIVKRVVGQEKGDIMKKELASPVEPLVDETRGSEIPKVDDNEVNFEVVDEQSFDQISDDKTDKKVNDVTEANIITVTGCKCSRKLLEYESKIKSLEDQLNLPLHSKILTNDKSCSFFTNFDKLELFHKFHDILSPLVRRRFQPVSQTQTKRQFITTPKKMGKERKLSSKDEFLLTMMKLRLGRQTMDLAIRFNVSEGSCSNIFLSWLRAMVEYFKAFVFIPNLETVLATSPDRFRCFKNLIGIIDCTEVFVETPKSLELQSATWSEYKHHNTVKFLVCVAPNSSVIYVSEGYTGRISDKALTKESGFLDEIPPFCSIMADKGFNLVDECAGRNITFILPPGKRGASQMTPAEVSKTSAIAKVRILVEQIIRRIKTFKILANELPMSMLENVNDIMLICAALCNFKEPMYHDYFWLFYLINLFFNL